MQYTISGASGGSAPLRCKHFQKLKPYETLEMKVKHYKWEVHEKTKLNLGAEQKALFLIRGWVWNAKAKEKWTLGQFFSGEVLVVCNLLYKKYNRYKKTTKLSLKQIIFLLHFLKGNLFF